MRNAQNTQPSLLDYPEDNNRHVSEWIRDVWDSKKPVHLIWLGQIGQILLQLLFLTLFYPVLRFHLPDRENPQGTFISELFYWGAAILPLLAPIILLPFAIWRIHVGWASGERWKPIRRTIGLLSTTCILGYIVLFMLYWD